VTIQRLVVLITCLAVAVLGVIFAVSQWEQASRIATVVSALTAVAALGVAVWTGLGPAQAKAVRAVDTGNARTRRGRAAVTGVSGSAAKVRGTVEAKNTGDAESDDGDAVSGIQLK
jgi:hypothetical protein